MGKAEIKIEEPLLEGARDKGVPVRLSLSNRERLTGRIVSMTKYDLDVEADGKMLTFPKREIFYISPLQEVSEAPTAWAMPEVSPVSKSRVQDEFLNRYITEKTLALVHLTNGEELRGVLEGYDGFTLSLRTSRGHVLLYKHGICCIGPGYRRHTGREDAK